METSDIIALSEHGLFPAELYKMNDFHCEMTSMSSRQLTDDDLGHKRGHGGCAILWKSSLSNCVRPLSHLGSDRMCVVQINLQNMALFVVAVYMPHGTCKISDFKSEMNILKDVYEEFRANDQVIIIGDMNVHYGSEYGHRCWGKSSTNANQLMHMFTECDLRLVDIGEKGNGESYTFYSSNSYSYIDHCAMSSELLSYVDECKIQEDHIMNVSDHFPIHVKLNVEVMSITSNWSRSQVAWHKLHDLSIYKFYTKPLESDLNAYIQELGLSYCDLKDDKIDYRVLGTLEEVEAVMRTVVNLIDKNSDSLPK